MPQKICTLLSDLPLKYHKEIALVTHLPPFFYARRFLGRPQHLLQVAPQLVLQHQPWSFYRASTKPYTSYKIDLGGFCNI